MTTKPTLTILLALGLNACADDDGPAEPDATAGACAGKCDDASEMDEETGEDAVVYEADIDALNREWPPPEYGAPMAQVEDAFSVEVVLGDEGIIADTHLFGSDVVVIPYDNSDAAVDVDGRDVGAGDAVIAEYFPRGEIGIAVKHHRPEYRYLNLGEADAAQMKEDFKLQDTHIELVVGVERNGRPGAVTLNNPQSYEDGRFGTSDYPMIFLRPAYPEYLSEDQQAMFGDNIRTMMMGFNAVSNFPGDYNGGDPLATTTPEKVREHVAQMVRAIAGDEEARAWFEDPLHQIYCAELAHVAFSAGLIVPLNADNVVPLVGQETWDLFVAEVEKQDRREPSAFTDLNENAEAQWVDVTLAPDSLRPASSYASPGSGAENQIAFQPMTMADIVVGFMATHIPRDVFGESTAPIQAAVLSQMKLGLLEAMGMDQIPAEDPRRQAIDVLFEQIVNTVGTEYESYEAFQAALEPLLVQARAITGPRDDTGTGLFVPPSLMHLIAQGRFTDGMMGLQYVGHGLHWSLVREALREPVVTEPPEGGTEVLFENYGLDANQEVVHEVRAPLGTQRLTFTLHSTDGDADLYVRRSEQATFESYDCRPYLGENETETCEYAPPGEETFFVLLHAFSDVQLEFTVTAE
ncbi:MAG: PPC domain-containing protein [Myxococcota bacterium]